MRTRADTQSVGSVTLRMISCFFQSFQFVLERLLHGQRYSSGWHDLRRYGLVHLQVEFPEVSETREDLVEVVLDRFHSERLCLDDCDVFMADFDHVHVETCWQSQEWEVVALDDHELLIILLHVCRICEY